MRATDGCRNTDPSPATRSFTVDTTPPETTIDAGPTGTTNDPTPSFEFHSSESGSSFECSLDTGTPAFGPCSGPGATHTPAALADGPYTFRVRATDGAANTDPSPATRSFTVDTTSDTTPPETTIDAGPADGSSTNNNDPSFAFSSSEPGSSFECKLDAGGFALCTTPKGYTDLADGEHTFSVRAIDPANNTDPSPATRSFTVDTTPPETTIDAGPTGTTNDPTPSFEFHSSESGSSFECSLDTGTPAFGPCSGPGATHTPAALADGPYTFRVRATDGAANTDPSPATRSFTVDTTPPETTIDAGPTGTTNDPTPTFEFHSSESGSSFECSLDTGTPAFGPCSGPGATHTPAALADGPYTFRVRATDGAANTDPSPATRSFTVDTTSDTTPPETTIDAGPADGSSTNNNDPSFAFSSSEPGSSFECKLDAGGFALCTTPKGYTDLADGEHTFSVRAIDPANNTDPSPATRSFTVDTTAARDDDRRRPDRHHQRPDPDLRIPLLRVGLELRMLARHRHPGLRALLGTGRHPHAGGAGRRPLHLPGPGHRRRRQHRPEPRHPLLHGRHHPARDDDRRRPDRHHQRPDPDLRIPLLRVGLELRMLARHRHPGLRALLGTGRHPHAGGARRRPLHLPGPGHRRRRQHRPQPRHPLLHGRHHRARHDDRRRPVRHHQRPDPELRIPLLRVGLELRMLARHRHPVLRALLGTGRHPHRRRRSPTAPTPSGSGPPTAPPTPTRAPPPAPSRSTPPRPRRQGHSEPPKCKAGFKKQKHHGKTKCVKIKKPRYGKFAVIAPVHGKVLIKVPGGKGFVPANR